jgi:hypothetical protein
MYCRIWDMERNGVEVPVSIDVILRNHQACPGNFAPQQCSNKIILETITKARPILALGLDGGLLKPEHPGFEGIQMLRDRLTVSSGRTGSNHGPILATLEAAAPPVKGRDVQGRNPTSETLFPVSWSNPLQQPSLLLDRDHAGTRRNRTGPHAYVGYDSGGAYSEKI